MSNKNELTAKLKGNFTLSGNKPTNAVNKRYRFLSMHDGLLNTVINNSMEEGKNSKEKNLNISKLNNNHPNSLNNTVNSDAKKTKNSSLPCEAKSTLKAVYPISSRNSAGKRSNIAHNTIDIPVPKNKNQIKKSSGEKNNGNNPNLTLKAKVNSSILFNVKDNKIKEAILYTNNDTNTNGDHNSSKLSEKEKLTEYYNNTTGSVNNSTSNNGANNNSGNSRNSKSKEKNKVESKMKIHNNNILEQKAVNFAHGSIPNNTITNPSFKKIIASDNSNYSNYHYNNSPREKSKKNFILNPTSSYNQNMKIADELSAYKLKNTRLENEILLLNEKIKSLNQTQIFFSNENDILKSKLTDLQEDYKRDLENLKKYKSELNQLKIINLKFNQNFKSSVNTLLDVIELFLSPRSNNPKQSLLYTDNNSYSIDIYDSYNNEEERRNVVFDQIQNLLISKFNIMKKILNVNFDAEIEKVKNWSNALNVNKSNNNDINVSNIKFSVKNYESSSYESSKKNSQDFFDLSISNQFCIKNNSPKFNNSFGIETENASEKLIKLNTGGIKGSNSNLIGTNAFNTNNFLSAGNLSLNNLNRMYSNANNNSFNNNNNILATPSDGNHNTNGNNCNINVKRRDFNASINNINDLSLSNMNSNFNNEINNNNISNNAVGVKENANEEKMVNVNLNFNDSFLKDLNNGQYDSFNENKGKFETQPNEENIRLNQQEITRDNLSNNEEININIEDCSIININAENKDHANNQNINKMFSFDLNDDQCEFNHDFNVAIGTNPINIKETIENEINEKENHNLSFKENNSPKGAKEFVILPPTVINSK